MYANTKPSKQSNPTSSQQETQVKQEPRRLTRETKEPTRINPTMTGKSYMQKKSYAEAVKTDYQVKEIPYNATCAMVASRVIEHFNEVHREAKINGNSFLET